MNKETRDCLNYLEQKIEKIRKRIHKIDFEVYPTFTTCINYKQGVVIGYYASDRTYRKILISICKQGELYYQVELTFKISSLFGEAAKADSRRFHTVSKLYMNEFISKLLKEMMGR